MIDQVIPLSDGRMAYEQVARGEVRGRRCPGAVTLDRLSRGNGPSAAMSGGSINAPNVTELTMNESLDQLKEAQHVPLAQLARNTAYELILTFILLFGVTTIVRWVIGPSLISRIDPADPCRASDRWCGRGVAPRGADPQSDGESVGGAYESCHLTRHVALRCLSRSRRSAVQYRPVARLQYLACWPPV